MLSRLSPLTSLVLLASLALAGCRMDAPDMAPDALAQAPVEPPKDTPAQQAERGDGAVSSGPVPTGTRGQDRALPTDWPSARVTSGTAQVSCQADYTTEEGDGVPLESLAFFSVVDALSPCQKGGVLRLRYQALLMQAVGAVLCQFLGLGGLLVEVHGAFLQACKAGAQVSALAVHGHFQACFGAAAVGVHAGRQGVAAGAFGMT